MINKAKQFVLKIPLTPPFPKGDCMVFSYSFVSQWLMSIPALRVVDLSGIFLMMTYSSHLFYKRLKRDSGQARMTEQEDRSIL